MIEAAQLRKGTVIELDGALYEVSEYELKKIGRGGANVKTKLKALERGSMIDRTFGSNDRLQDVRLETRRMQYMYNDGEYWHFMHTDGSYEQLAADRAAVEEAIRWLKEQDICQVTLWDSVPIGVAVPNFVELEVEETDPGLKGDTASGGTKPATLSTGAVVKVPLFVNIGDVIRIDTRTGEYQNRVKS